MTPSRRALLTLLAACSPWPRPARSQAGSPNAEVKIGGTLPDVRMSGLNGPDRDLSAYRGRPLIINVWASWCGPCRQEMASLERLAWEPPADVPLRVIGISTDDDRDQALRWLRASNATLSHFIDRRLQLETMLGASQIPLTVLVDAQGKVVEKVVGARDWDGPEARALIRRSFGRRGSRV